MESLVLVLLAWLSANTEFDISLVPVPNIVELGPREITLEYYSEYPGRMPASGIDERVQALYSWEDSPHGTIYILGRSFTEPSMSQEQGLNNPLFQERLLHELVHHVQYHLGHYDSYECQNEGELQAYLYAGRFLQSQNVSDPLPNRRVLAHMYSRC